MSAYHGAANSNDAAAKLASMPIFAVTLARALHTVTSNISATPGSPNAMVSFVPTAQPKSAPVTASQPAVGRRRARKQASTPAVKNIVNGRSTYAVEASQITIGVELNSAADQMPTRCPPA